MDTRQKKKSKRKTKEENGRESENREGERKEKKFLFSLRSTKIGPYVFVIAKGKVDPRITSYAWVPKSWSFIKLHEVRNFPPWVISRLKVI